MLTAQLWQHKTLAFAQQAPDQENLAAFWQQNRLLRSRIMRCYEPGLRAPTPLAGQITLSLRVLPNGSVTGVRTLNDPGLTTITDAVGFLSFLGLATVFYT